MNPATIGAFFLGLQRLAAMGAAVWFYVHNNPTAAVAFFAYATGTQLWDNLKVDHQIQSAKTTTSVTVEQPVNTPTPVQLQPMAVVPAPPPTELKP